MDSKTRSQELCDIFYKNLKPGKECLTRRLFGELESIVISAHPHVLKEAVYHSEKSDIFCIDKSDRIIVLDFEDKSNIKHKNFIPGSAYRVRTLFFRDDTRYVRLYCDKDWQSNRRRIDLIDFLIEIAKKEEFILDEFEKFLLRTL